MPEAFSQAFAPPSVNDPILAELVHRLRELYRPERIYLFGSTARGESDPDSDYDLMLVGGSVWQVTYWYGPIRILKIACI
ncbi:MAG: nucleotidyltransferase domain-containing protein [Bryobacteraceae bacterium]